MGTAGCILKKRRKKKERTRAGYCHKTPLTGLDIRVTPCSKQHERVQVYSFFFFFLRLREWLRGAILKRNPWAATPWEKLADSKQERCKKRGRERFFVVG